MVGVGALAALISVAMIFAVAIGDFAVERIMLNFATSRLHRTRRAPVVHDSDIWLFNIPRSVLKYYRHPAILITVLCAVFLIVSEIVVEFGVDVSLKCKPVEKEGLVIRGGDTEKTFTTFELGYSAGYIQSIDFLDENLTFVKSGMPKKMDAIVCLPCLDKGDDDILRHCLISHVRTYGPGELQVGVVTTEREFGTISKGFKETVGERREFLGEGDLTKNGPHASIYSFAESDRDPHVLMLFEYGHQKHIKQLLNEAKESRSQIWRATEGPVRVTQISCTVNELSPARFQLAVMTYRTVQLENPAFLAVFNDTEEQFVSLTEDDVYRAVLSMKIMEDTEEVGKYSEYTSCGIFNWTFLAPLIAVLSLIFILGVISFCASTTTARVPHNSRGWYHHATQRSRNWRNTSESETSGYFGSIFEEVLLVPDVHGSDTPRVVFRSRSFNSRESPADISLDELYG